MLKGIINKVKHFKQIFHFYIQEGQIKCGTFIFRILNETNPFKKAVVTRTVQLQKVVLE